MRKFLDELGGLAISGLILFGSLLLVAAIFGIILYCISGGHDILWLRIVGVLLLLFLMVIAFKA